MSELDSDAKVDMQAQDQQLEVAAGRMLREARESKGLTVAVLAASLKVSVKKIEAIESGRFDLLPDMVFARALAFSICRNLKIDADPILEQFPPSIAHHLKSDASGINTPFHASQGDSRFKALQGMSRPVAIFSAILIIAALTLYAFPLFYPAKLGGSTPAPVSKLNIPAEMPDKLTAQTVVPLEVASAPIMAPAPGFPASKEVLVVAGSGATTGNIVFKSRGVSWVEVVDAKGSVQLRKTLIAGELVGVSGALPLIVVVGKADTMDVSVAGQPFNLMGIAKDNVARFEVK